MDRTTLRKRNTNIGKDLNLTGQATFELFKNLFDISTTLAAEGAVRGANFLADQADKLNGQKA